jgi:hypothetical protein
MTGDDLSLKGMQKDTYEMKALVLAWVLVLVCTVSQIMFFKQRDARKIL